MQRVSAWLLGLAAAVLLAGCPAEPGVDLGAAPPPPQASEFRAPGVERAVEAASDIVSTRGFSGEGGPWRGFLVEHTTDVHEQAMRAGTCYVFLAGSSTAMRELNLRVFDSDGGEVVQDTTTGPRAALRYCPAQSGTYYLVVQASAGSGLFEARLFRGPSGLEIRTDDVFRDQAPRESP